jgi:hypothetical protein
MTNSITEFTKQRPKEPGRYLMREGFEIFYLVLKRDHLDMLYVDRSSSAGASAAYAWHLYKPEFAKIELDKEQNND